MRKTVLNTLKAPVQAYSVLTVNKPLQVAIARLLHNSCYAPSKLRSKALFAPV